jgi:NAD(P)-dependent dehydrogenase (short-subunit alcohol dehydrogenase family)
MSARGRVLSRLVNPRHHLDDRALERAVGGQVAVVTGASHGIGCEVARRLAAAGARVLLVARSADVLDELAAEIGPAASALPCDLADLEAAAALGDRLLAVHGHVDCVVSNAGKSIRRPIAASYDRMSDFTRLMDVNYLGPVQLLLGLLPAMRARGSGHVVNVSTIGVLVPPAPRWAAYVSSKAAFDTWLRSVATETAADGVTASAVYLALVKTRMSAPTRDFDNVPGLTAEQAAGVVCRAIVERPAAIAPWWAKGAGAVGHLARRPAERYMRRYGERLPDGSVAR